MRIERHAVSIAAAKKLCRAMKLLDLDVTFYLKGTFQPHPQHANEFDDYEAHATSDEGYVTLGTKWITLEPKHGADRGRELKMRPDRSHYVSRKGTIVVVGVGREVL